MAHDLGARAARWLLGAMARTHGAAGSESSRVVSGFAIFLFGKGMEVEVELVGKLFMRSYVSVIQLFIVFGLGVPSGTMQRRWTREFGL